MAKRAYLRKTRLYDSKGAVEPLKFCYTQNDTAQSMSALRTFKKTFSSKSDRLAHDLLGHPAWVEVNPGQPNEERFFLSYAGKIAPWERKGAKTHNFLNPAYTNGDHACVVGPCLRGNVDVPHSRPCKKLTKLPPALYKAFTIRSNKSEPLRNNSNAGHSASTSSSASAAPMRECKRRNEDAKPDRNKSATEERKLP